MKRLVMVVFLWRIVWSGPLFAKEDIRDLSTQADKASQSAARDVKAWLKSLAKKDDHCHSKETKPERLGQCRMRLPAYEDRTRGMGNNIKLFIFVSASMPPSSIKALGEAAQKIGARVVFQGLIGGTFQHTQGYMKDLGIMAEIDPTKFEDYQITHVPTFVLAHNKKFDRVSGHISLWEALAQFSNKGELKEEAQKLYGRLEGGSFQGAGL